MTRTNLQGMNCR